MSKKRRAKIPPFRVLNSENIFRKFVSKIMRSCDKNFAQLQYATQPFIEYGFEDFIKSVMLYVGVGLGISLITFIFKVKQDEL